MKKRTLFFALLISLNVFAQKPSVTAIDFYESGLANFNKKDYKGAITLFTTAINKSSDSTRFLLKRAEAYMLLHNMSGAYDDLTAVVNKDSYNALAYLLRAKTLEASNMLYDAIKDNNMALMLSKSDSITREARIANASIKNSLRDFKGSIADYNKVLETDSLRGDIFNDIGMSYLEINDSAKAIRCVKKAMLLDTALAMPSYGNLGFIYSKYNMHKEAIACFDSVINHRPNGYAYNNRGYSKYMLGNLDDAMSDINKSLDLFPNNSYAYRNRALVYLKSDKTKKACADLNKAIALGYTAQYGKEVDELLKKHCK
jgi:tetratricopeptide (TPR) repeat protein